MKNIYCILTILCALGMTTSAFAEPQKLRPGLWEYTFEVSSQSGQLEAAIEEARKAMEAMPPEQRKMVEQMMEAQGMSVDLNMQTTTFKTCITEEQAKNYALPQNEGCTQELKEIGDDHLEMTFNCDGNPPSSGEGEIRIHNEKTYSGNLKINTMMMGKPETMQAKQSGQWLTDDCGDTKSAQ